MEIDSITKIHTDPGDVLLVVVDKINPEEGKELAIQLKKRLDRVLVIVTDGPIDVHRLTAEQLNKIAKAIEKTKI
jgi:hypothetical protein